MGQLPGGSQGDQRAHSVVPPLPEGKLACTPISKALVLLVSSTWERGEPREGTPFLDFSPPLWFPAPLVVAVRPTLGKKLSVLHTQPNRGVLWGRRRSAEKAELIGISRDFGEEEWFSFGDG